jgi:hypothetical protein
LFQEVWCDTEASDEWREMMIPNIHDQVLYDSLPDERWGIVVFVLIIIYLVIMKLLGFW